MDNIVLQEIKDKLNEQSEKKKENQTKVATELEYLRWIYQHMDFGPAHGDVMLGLQEYFKKRTGKEIPEGYREE